MVSIFAVFFGFFMSFTAIETTSESISPTPRSKPHRPTPNAFKLTILIVASLAASVNLSHINEHANRVAVFAPPAAKVAAANSELEAPAAGEVTASDVTATRDDLLVDYISWRWSVPARRAAEFVFTATRVAARESLDPLLILAIIANESSFKHMGNMGDRSVGIDPSQVNPMRSHGPMQVAGMWHPDSMPVDRNGRIRVTTTAENIVIGTQILRGHIRREGGNVKRALLRYNGSLNDGSAKYANRVLRFRTDMQKALTES